MTSSSPLIFLDFDDVICTGKPLCAYDAWDVVEVMRGMDGRTDRKAVMAGVSSPKARQALLDVISARPEVGFVISSSWRKMFDRDQIVEMLREMGLGPVAERVLPGDRWCTPLGEIGGTPRPREIMAWLRSYHQGQPYAVIDDEKSGPSLVEKEAQLLFAQRVIMCTPGLGLVPEQVAQILKALARPAPRRSTLQGRN